MVVNKVEDKILQDCLRGKKRGQRKLYDLYANPMMGVCLRYLKNVADAEDALQDGFITIFRKIHTFKGTGPLGAWIYKIIVNTALEHLRKKKSVSFECPDSVNIYEEDEHEVDINNTLTKEQLMSLVRNLPDKYSTVFNMYVIDGYKHQEIAKILDISENTSKSQLLRARVILQKKIKVIRKQQELNS